LNREATIHSDPFIDRPSSVEGAHEDGDVVIGVASAFAPRAGPEQNNLYDISRKGFDDLATERAQMGLGALRHDVA